VGLFEDDVFEEILRHDVLLLHGTVTTLLLTDDDSGGLGLEQDAAVGDGGCTAVLCLGDADAGETDLEDADALQSYLLTHLEEVLQGVAQLQECGHDVTLLDGTLLLDVVGNRVGLDEVLVVDGCCEELAVGGIQCVVVLGFDKFLCHDEK